jgi:hypothetical protein
MSLSIGDITETRFWLSFEWRKYPQTWYFTKPHFGKTYNGTKRGIVWQVGPLVIIGHERDLNAV